MLSLQSLQWPLTLPALHSTVIIPLWHSQPRTLSPRTLHLPWDSLHRTLRRHLPRRLPLPHHTVQRRLAHTSCLLSHSSRPARQWRNFTLELPMRPLPTPLPQPSAALQAGLALHPSWETTLASPCRLLSPRAFALHPGLSPAHSEFGSARSITSQNLDLALDSCPLETGTLLPGASSASPAASCCLQLGRPGKHL